MSEEEGKEKEEKERREEVKQEAKEKEVYISYFSWKFIPL